MFFKSIRLRIFSSVLLSDKQMISKNVRIASMFVMLFYLLVISDYKELDQTLLFFTFDVDVSLASTEASL